MKAFLVILFISAHLAQLNPAEEGKKHVQQLTFTNFDNIINKGFTKRWFVMAQSPSCRHCKEFKPLFNKLAYDNREGPVKFAEVNCSDERQLCKLLRIKAYPSLFVIDNNKMYSFSGARNEDNLNRFIRDEWDQARSYRLPDKLPSFWEEIYNGFMEMTNEIGYVYKSKNLLLKVFISIFLIVLASLIGAIGYFLYAAVVGVMPKKKKTKGE